jgi:hypothetical protein
MWFQKPQLEQDLEDIYTAKFAHMMGDASSAKRTVREAIKMCAAQSKAERTGNLSGEFGRALLAGASSGVEPAISIVAKARGDGATDEDIIEWWSLPDLQRRMIIWSEEIIRFTNFKSIVDDGLSPDAGMARVRRMFPMYGDPTDVRHVQGDDRPLPQELRGRIDVYRERHGAAAILGIVEKHYRTFNAFVRARVRAGEL